MRSGQGIWISTGFSHGDKLQFSQQFGITDVAIQSYDTSVIPNCWENCNLSP